MISRARVTRLLGEVARGPSTQRERELALALEQLKVEHEFAFAQWQQNVKRASRLSMELAQATLVELRAEDAKTRVNAGARVPPKFDEETAKTRYFRHSGGALVVKTGRVA